jgi:hypothetical protein
MKPRVKFALRVTGFLAVSTTAVLAQAVVLTESQLDHWFNERCYWGMLVGLIGGVLVGWLHISRLRFRPPDLTLDRPARLLFLEWLALAMFVGGIVLLIDAWSGYNFGSTMTLADAFENVWLGYRTLMMLGLMGLSFFVGVALATHFAPNSVCPFALWPSWGRTTK